MSKNQCDGCRASRPVDHNGNHRMSDNGHDLMACQKDRYVANKPVAGPADEAAKLHAASQGSVEANRACPCLHTVPCDPRCSCVNPIMSMGCWRCCAYGSPDQQRAAAERLVSHGTGSAALAAARAAGRAEGVAAERARERLTVDTVTSCDRCPFSFRSPVLHLWRCLHPAHPSGDRVLRADGGNTSTDEEIEAGATPEWCPLKTEPVLVQWADKAITDEEKQG